MVVVLVMLGGMVGLFPGGVSGEVLMLVLKVSTLEKSFSKRASLVLNQLSQLLICSLSLRFSVSMSS